MLKKLLVILLFVFVVSVSTAGAEDYAFGYAVAKEADGKIVLKFKTTALGNDMGIGVTMYPAQTKNAAKDAFTQVLPIKKGVNEVSIAVDPKFKNGTFEAAVWSKIVSKKDCPATDTLCQTLGYKSVGYRVSYMFGFIYAP